jgi:sugar lactone lactonase YvrE
LLGGVSALVLGWLVACSALAAPEAVIPGTSSMHGLQGITVGPDGALYVSSITGRAIYRVDPATGRTTTFVGAPEGASDDLTFAADCTLVWTGGTHLDALLARSPAGDAHAIVSGVKGPNAVRFAADGRLYYTLAFMGDGIYEADPGGHRPSRTLAEGLGAPNAFDFLPDGSLAIPLFLRGTIIRLDPRSGEMRTLAEGFESPSSLRVVSDGFLVLEYRSGIIWHLDAQGAGRRRFASVPSPADNMIVRDGRELFVTSTAYNGITRIDLRTRAARRVTWGELTAPGALAVTGVRGSERILIADEWALREYNPRSRAVRALPLGLTTMGARIVAARGETWYLVSGYDPGTILVLDAVSGTLRAKIPGFARILGLLADDSGLIIADAGRGEVVRVDPNAPQAREVLASGLAVPVGLARAAGGALYVSEYGTGRILELRSNAPAPVVLAEGLRTPEGLAVARDGRLLVVDSGTRELLVIDPRTRLRTVVARDLAVGFAPGDDVPRPYIVAGVVVTADGAAYVSASVSNALYRLKVPP